MAGEFNMLEGLENPNTQIAFTQAALSEAGARAGRLAFISRLPQMPPQFTTDLQNGKATLYDHVIYGVRDIDGNRFKIFREDDKIKTGITNVSEGKLRLKSPIVIHKLTLEYSPNITEEGDAPEAFITDIFPPELRNGDLSIRREGVMIIDKLPISVFTNTIGDGDLMLADNNRMYGEINLDNPITLKGEELLDVEIELAAELEGAVKVKLHGTSIRSIA